MNRGLLLILSGASSVGKEKIRDLLLNNEKYHFFYSISMTTRKPHAKEIDGKDYYFVDQKTFAAAIKDKALLEYTEFDGHYYGTPKSQIEFLLSTGKNVLIEVEAQGVGKIKLHYPEAVSVFVMPQSFDDLKDQINERYKDDQSSIERRINKASVEMELAPLFRNIVYNDDNDKAYRDILEILDNYEYKKY